MRRTLAHRCAGVLVLLVSRLHALAGSEDAALPVFRSSVSEVQITFTALDQNRHAVATLTAADVAVIDRESIVRNFLSFNRIDYTRMDMALLIDASESVGPHTRQTSAQLMRLLELTSVVPEQSISVAAFHGAHLTSICNQDCRSAPAEDIANAASSGGLTPLFDHIMLAADTMLPASNAKARRVLILFSDGEDNYSRNFASDAVDALLKKDIRVYAVDIAPSQSPSRGTSFLKNLSAHTGGRYFRLDEGADAIVNALLEDFHASYQVTYKLESPGAGFHETRIFPTHNLNLTFRCPWGYFYLPSGQ